MIPLNNFITMSRSGKRKRIFLASICLISTFLIVGWPGLRRVRAVAFQSSDVGIVESAPSTVASGANLTYTITVLNNGPDDAPSASWTDPLPAGTNFVSISPVPGWSCSDPGVGNNGTVTCSNSSFPVESDTFSLVVNVTAAGGTNLVNAVTISSENPDDNDENNTSSAGTLVSGGGNSADVGVTKSGPDQTLADKDVTYTITVTNFGPNPATNVSMTDTLPDSVPSGNAMSFVSFTQTSGPFWNCGSPSSTASCKIASLPVGSSSFSFVGHVPPSTAGGTEYTNQAFITSDNDPNSENDSSSAATQVVDCSSSQFFFNPIVITNADSGAGSLRQAIGDACVGSTITFDMSQVVSPISLTSGELLINKNLTIQGPSADLMTISGSNLNRIFTVGQFNVTLKGLTLANGKVTSATTAVGGGILNSGTLTITECAISGNSVAGGSDDAGGGIINGSGSLTILNSTVSGNSAAGGSTANFGGGIFNAGGSLNIINSTISGNSISGGSGDNHGAGISNGGTLSITNSTVSGNAVSGGSAPFAGGINAQGPTFVRNTIIAGNSGHTSPDVSGTFTSQGNNLIGKADGSMGFTVLDQVGTIASPLNALLAALGNYGGPTQTHALLPGSPAINAANNCVTDVAHCGDANIPQLSTDQRGLARQVNGVVDIGAFESSGFTLTALSGTPQSAGIGSAFAAPLIASIVGFNSEPVNGGIVTFTAPASGPSATLTGGTTTANVTIGGGQASTNAIANGVAGSYSVNATTVGATSAAFNLTNNKGNTTTSVTSPGNPSVFGQPVTFMATVSAVAPAPGTPTGTLTFLEGGNPIGTAPLGGGVATFTTSALSVGNHTITTFYNGDGNFNGGSGSLIGNPQIVNKANTTTTVTSALNPSAIGQPVTFTATVFAASLGAGTPTGTVTFLDGANSIGTAPLGGGVANFTTSALSVGNHTITTSYSGNGNLNGSTGSLTGNPQVVNKGNTSTTVTTSLNPSVFGQPVTFTATVSPVGSGVGTPTGSVTFLDGGNSLGTANLGSGGVATFTTSALAGGSHTITASYNGDGNFNGSNAQLSQVVNKAGTTTAITSPVNPSDFGQPVTFTATISAVSPGAGTATGTVQFKDNGNNLGVEVTLNAGGSAQFTTSSLTIGNHNITAVYSGDGNFLSSSGSLAGGQTLLFRPLIKFSQPNYSVNENGNFITITVVRTGDTTPAVAVDYTTPDDSAALTFLPCSNANGVASPRCDFTTALGTLKFGPGETNKTFTVLISQETWVEGNETVPLTLSNPTGGAAFQQPSDASAVLTIVDDDLTSPTTNAIDDSNNFVRQHYHDFLNREPDATGFSFWTNQIESCGADAQCRAARRVNVSSAFFLSIEFQNTGYFVERMYKAGFGDINPPTVPVPVRFTSFVRDSQEVRGDIIVGSGNWQAQLDANKTAFALAFVQRAAFLNRYPPLTSATAFVDSLNANAGMVLSAAERSALIAELSANPSDPVLRADVLQKVAENQTLQQREFNRAFVLMEYFGYLRRNPDAAPEPGLNFNGYNFWVNKLNQFNGDFIGSELIKAFITSSEYRGRFGP